MMMTYIHGCNYSLIPWLSTRAISGVCVWKLHQGQTTTTTVFCLQNFSGISLYNKVYSKSNMQNPCRDSWGCEWLGLGRLFCVHWGSAVCNASNFQICVFEISLNYQHRLMFCLILYIILIQFERFLTHCGLLLPYSGIDVGHHWLR